MKINQAVNICYQIESSKFSEEEKALAIHTMLNMETHNSVPKSIILNVIKFLFNKIYELESE